MIEYIVIYELDKDIVTSTRVINAIKTYLSDRRKDMEIQDDIIKCRFGDFFELVRSVAMRMLTWNQFLKCSELCSVLEELRLELVDNPDILNKEVTVRLGGSNPFRW